MNEPSAPLRATERRHPDSANIDQLGVEALVQLFLAEDAGVPRAVAGAALAITNTLAMIESVFQRSGRLIYVGAGTSGRLGVLDASECPPTFGTDPDMVQGIIAGGPAALVRSVEGAEDNAEAGGAAITERRIGENDMVIGIAASGTTPFVHAALTRAHEAGAKTAFLTCAAPPERMREICDEIIHVDVGPELVTGSTRLKAGTATKLVLNMLTTGAMIRIGKTWGNLMVDLQATNVKLRDRGERIVMEVLGVAREVARAAIEEADGGVRTAIVMLHHEVDRQEAEALLAEAGYHLREIVGPPPPVSS